MPWRDFFDQYISGYLLSDLAEMNEINTKSGMGNCCYPMLMAILSGIELLGGLTYSNDEKWNTKSDSGKKYFNNFFEKYLKKQNEECYKDMSDDLYKLLRHKLVHTFLTATHYKVAKNTREKPIGIESGFTVIDAGRVYKDFRKSVEKLIEDLQSDHDLSSRFEKRLKDMMSEYTATTISNSSSSESISTTTSGTSSLRSSSRFSSNVTTTIPPNFNNVHTIKIEENDYIDGPQDVS